MKKNENVMGNVFKKISYAAGFACAKVAKLKNITDTQRWRKTSSGIKSFFIETAQKTTDILEDAKDSLAGVGGSFKGGFESAEEEAVSDAGQETQDTSEQIEDEPEKEDKLEEGGQRMKESPQELVNPELEKEIEEITQGVAET